MPPRTSATTVATAAEARRPATPATSRPLVQKRACQIAALFPGISRSGVTMAAGLMAGLRHQEAARFAFLLATPIILAAGLVEVPQLGPRGPGAGLAVGAAALAGVAAYLSARFLLRYLRFGRLDPFAYYCAALGAAGVILLR